MAQFDQNVFKLFCPLLSKFGFRKALAASGARRAALVAKANDDICVYLFVTDGRPGGANVDVVLWVAPMDFPGDGLDKLGVGIRVEISAEYEIDDAFMEASARKAARYIPHFMRLAEVVSEELAAPVRTTERLESYRIERDYLHRLLEILQRSDANIAQQLDALSAKAASSGRRAYEQLETFLSDVMERLDSSGQLAIPEPFRPIPDGVRGGIAARHLYVKSLFG